MNNAFMLTGTAFIVIGVVTALLLLVKIRKASASKRWPHVYGELESTDLKKVIYEGGEIGGGTDSASALVVNFRYHYTVDGTRYSGSRVTFSDGINKPVSALKKLQQKYRGKIQILVYYNPDKPDESVLIPGLNLFNFTPLITSSLFILAGIYLFNLEP